MDQHVQQTQTKQNDLQLTKKAFYHSLDLLLCDSLLQVKVSLLSEHPTVHLAHCSHPVNSV